MTIALQSVRNLKPLNKGGAIARSGFSFQDHIAVGFCLEMASSPDLVEVWCETHDDITLIWCKDGVDKVEFVQVKDLDLDQLWTVAKLCEREGAKEGTSILERSLGEDRCLEPCCFRIVTSLGVKNELEILTMPFLSPERSGNLARHQNLTIQIENKLGHVTSPKGTSLSQWVEKTIWQNEHSSEAVQNKNNNLLSKLISKIGYDIPIEMVEEKIYPNLLQLVRSAAEIDPDLDLEHKRILRDPFINQIKSIIDDLIRAQKAIAGEKIVEKMEKAGIPDYIDTALEQRRLYRKEKLDPQYLELSDFDLIDGEILSTLQSLRLKMDFGEIEAGREFYKICLDNLDLLRTTIKTKAIAPTYYFHGCMHDITDRCWHRYHKELP
jgi:hypothetical protein